MALNIFSSMALEGVLAAGRGFERSEDLPAPEYWMQLCRFQTRKFSESILRRAELAGFKAVVLTVDAPYLGTQYNEIRNEASFQSHIKLGNFVQAAEGRAGTPPVK
jgi:(S)-2-hydroxy-acid oxidase